MKKVAVVGAGLVGSLWALYLGRRGYEVEVFERRPDMRKGNAGGGRSINLALSDRGLKALRGVGLEEKVREMAIPMHGRMIHAQDGTLDMQPYGLEGQYINSISRAGLNELLMTEAEKHPNVHFSFEHRCLDIDLEDNRLFFEGVNGSSIEKQFGLIFGTDGAFSAVRTAMMRTDRFNFQQEYLKHGYKELTIPPSADGDFQMEPNALHIWPRKSFMLIALPNPDKSFTCTLFLAFEGEVSFEQIRTPEDARAFFQEYFADALPLIENLERSFFENPTSSLVTVRCQPWARNDSTLLLGDAAHAIVPFYGQGMNAGFEDCTVLNAMIEDYKEDWPHILRDFSVSRKPDADAIADLAYRNFIEMRDLVADERFVNRKKIEKAIHKLYPDNFMPLYSMVTFSDIPYAEALATGRRHDEFFRKMSDFELEAIVGELNTDAGKQKLMAIAEELKGRTKELTK